MERLRGGGRARGRARRIYLTSSSAAEPASSTPEQSPVSVVDAAEAHAAESPLPAAVRTPQTAPAAKGRAPKGHGLAPSATFSASPTTSMSLRGPSLRKRSRTMDPFDAGVEADDDNNQKGGHSLRRRQRVDYTFEQQEDETVGAANPISSTLIANNALTAAAPTTAPAPAHPPRIILSRSRKRKADPEDESEDVVAAKRRQTAEREMFQAAASESPSSGRRKNPSRRSTAEAKVYADSLEDQDELDVKDTIEVGGAYDSDSSPPMPSSQASSGNSQASPDNRPPHRESLTVTPVGDYLRTARDATPRTPQGQLISGVAEGSGQTAGPSPVDNSRHDTRGTRRGTEPKPQRSSFIITLKVTPNSTRAATVLAGSQPRTPKPVEHPAQQLAEQHVQVPSEATIEKTTGQFTGSARAASLEPEPPVEPAKRDMSEDILGHMVTPLIMATPEPMDAEPVAREELDGAMETAGASMTATDKQLKTEPIEGMHDPEPLDDAAAPEASTMDEEIPIDPALAEAMNTPQPVTNTPAEATAEMHQLEEAAVQNSTTEVVDEPADEVMEDAPAEKAAPDEESNEEELAISWKDLTPFIAGQYVSHPERLPEAGNAADMPDDEDADAVKDAVEEEQDETPKAGDQVNGLAKPDIEIEDTDPDSQNKEGSNSRTPHSRQPGVDSGAATPLAVPSLRGSPNPESAVPSIVGSPLPIAEPEEDEEMQHAPEKTRRGFHKFPKLRPIEHFATVFRNHEEMSTDDLIQALEQANACLVEWQEEWKQCGKVVDDYENALRRREHDAEYEKRTRNLYANLNSSAWQEKDFELKGYRAKDKTEPGNYYLRAQDRIQAATYGFDYDPHANKIGKQNPEMQRDGIVTRRTLRNQPRQTARAAEADDGAATTNIPGVIAGKRTRKPRELFDGVEGSRSGTPVPTRGSGRRGGRGRRVDADHEAFGHQLHVPDSYASGTRKPRGRRKAIVTSENVTPAPSLPGDSASVADEPINKPNGRRRGPRAPRAKGFADEMDQAFSPGQEGGSSTYQTQQPARRGRGGSAAGGARRGQNLSLAIPVGSFNNGGVPLSAATDATDDSRPSTSSSASNSTVESSSYDFRPKRQRNFRDAPEEEEEEEQQLPPRKRPRRAATKKEDKETYTHTPLASGVLQAPAVTMTGGFVGSPSSLTNLAAPHGLAAPDPMAADHPPHTLNSVLNPNASRSKIVRLKMKMKNRPLAANAPSPASSTHTAATAHGRKAGVGSSEASPAPSQPGQELDSGAEKDYSQMTKSEKMSHSMKTRWASGSMQAAVDKRKATLAAKKAAMRASIQLSMKAPDGPSPTQPQASHQPTPPPPPPPQQSQKQQQQQPPPR